MLRFLQNNWEKTLLWAILVGLLYLLRPFFLLIFETFLITYITRGLVLWLTRRFCLNYRLTTVGVFLVFVACLVAVAVWVGPKLVLETHQLVRKFAESRLTPRAVPLVPATELPIAPPDLEAPAAPEPPPPPLPPATPTIGPTAPPPAGEPPTEGLERYLDELVTRLTSPPHARAILASEEYQAGRGLLKRELARSATDAAPRLVRAMLHLVVFSWEMLIYLLLAIIFSFMLVLDWQRIGDAVRRLEHSRVRTFYLGCAPHLCAFAEVLGKALRAQAMIALCNTILTCAGLWLLNVPNIALLSTIVFFCGFIPILGTFLSSIPIVLLGIQAGGGPLALKLLIMIAAVHAFEAYVLNPRITAHVLHAHPILILILLVVGERFFGIWGMVIGVPVGYYVISVLAKQEAPEAAAAVVTPGGPAPTCPPPAKPRPPAA